MNLSRRSGHLARTDAGSHLPGKTMLLADRGYDVDAILQTVAAQGALANILLKTSREAADLLSSS